MKLDLLGLIDYHDYQISSRSLSKKLSIKQALTLYAMDKDETISPESCPQTKLLQVLEGQLEISLADGGLQTLSPQEVLAIPAGQSHALRAVERSKFLELELD